MASLRRTPWSLVLWLAPALGAQAAPEAVAGLPDAPALFVRACAACHGLDGSGTGPSVLDRPARNFKEGGFSFGNTVEAIERTLAHGIPGSPMPGFEGALTEAERHALAEYVITLGPPIKEVTEAETLLVVRDRPLIVRGILPPLVEGGPPIARGLLIGRPDGLTFEYAIDDVRLLAVRLGDFVKRTDWSDRGGTPLEPLGKVIWSHDAPAGPWSAVESEGNLGEPLVARLLSTTSAPEAEVAYVVGRPATARSPLMPRALVVERPGAARLAGHAGFARHLRVSPLGESTPDHTGAVALRWGGWIEELGAVHDEGLEIGGGHRVWMWMRTLGPDTGEVLRISWPSPDPWSQRLNLIQHPTGLVGLVDLSPPLNSSEAAAVEFDVETFVISPWTPEVIASLSAGGPR